MSTIEEETASTTIARQVQTQHSPHPTYLRRVIPTRKPRPTRRDNQIHTLFGPHIRPPRHHPLDRKHIVRHNLDDWLLPPAAAVQCKGFFEHWARLVCRRLLRRSVRDDQNGRPELSGGHGLL